MCGLQQQHCDAEFGVRHHQVLRHHGQHISDNIHQFLRPGGDISLISCQLKNQQNHNYRRTLRERMRTFITTGVALSSFPIFNS
jgi:hypothetical protein